MRILAKSKIIDFDTTASKLVDIIPVIQQYEFIEIPEYMLDIIRHKSQGQNLMYLQKEIETIIQSLGNYITTEMPNFSESDIDTYYDKIKYYCKKIGIGYNLEPLEKNINILHNKKITIMNEYLKNGYTRDIFLELYTQKMVNMNIYKECITKTIAHILNVNTHYVEDTRPVCKSKKITTKKKIVKKARISDSEYDTDNDDDNNNDNDNHIHKKSEDICAVITDTDLIQFDKILNEIYEITGSDMDYINPIIEEFIKHYSHFNTNTSVNMDIFCNIMKTIAKCTKNLHTIARIIHKVIVLSFENADIHVVFSRELSKIAQHEFSEHVQYIFHCMSVSLERDLIINRDHVFPKNGYVPLDFDKYIGIKKDVITFFEFVKSLKHIFPESNIALNKEDDGYDDIARSIFTQSMASNNSPRNKNAYYDISELTYTP